jgi:hypothetical protein
LLWQRRCCRGSVRYPAPRGVRERAVPRPVVWCARARARRPGQLGLQRTGPRTATGSTTAAWWRLAWRAGARRRGIHKRQWRGRAVRSGTAHGRGRTSTRAAWVHGLKQQASVAIPRAGGMQTCDHIGTSFLASSKWQINLQSVLLIMTLHSMHARSGSRVEPAPFARLASRPG